MDSTDDIKEQFENELDGPRRKFLDQNREIDEIDDIIKAVNDIKINNLTGKRKRVIKILSKKKEKKFWNDVSKNIH